MEQEIVDYIGQAQKHGLTEFEIKQNLLNAGWEAAVVEENFVFAKASDNRPTTAREAAAAPAFNHPVSAHPQITITEKTPGPLKAADNGLQNNQPSKNLFKKPVFWVSLIVLFALAASAYGYYNYVYLTPARIWDNFLSAKKIPTLQSQYTFSYSGGSQASGTVASFGLTGNSALDYSDIKNPKISGTTGLNLAYDGLSYNLSFNYALLGQIFYMDVGDIAALKPYLSGQNLTWVKFDFNEIKTYLSQNNSSSTVDSLNNPRLAAELNGIWTNSNIIKPTNFLARENLNGVPVYHLQEQVDAQALNTAVLNSINAMQTTSGQTITDQDKTQLSALLNRFQVKQFDVWIGRSNYQPYKLNLTLSAPSVEDFSNPAVAAVFSPPAARDAQRLSDIRKLASALQLYHNDFGGYPAAAAGTPQNLTPSYITSMPTAPSPADGTCTDYFNGYWYKVSGKSRTVNGEPVYPSFTLTFCLGSATGGYKAGIGELTPKGIQDNIACPAAAEQCVGSGQNSTQAYLDAVSKMDFAGQISLSLTNSNFGQAQNIQAPASSTDFLDLFKNSGFAPVSTTTAQSLSQ